jgi:hypothetical protein
VFLGHRASFARGALGDRFSRPPVERTASLRLAELNAADAEERLVGDATGPLFTGGGGPGGASGPHAIQAHITALGRASKGGLDKDERERLRVAGVVLGGLMRDVERGAKRAVREEQLAVGELLDELVNEVALAAARDDAPQRVVAGVLDRMLTPQTPLDEASKCALVSMDSTLKSNLSVGLPLDLLVYENGALCSDQLVCIDEHNPYFQMIRGNWGQKLRQVFESIEDPQWALSRASIDDPHWGLATPAASDAEPAQTTTTPLCVKSARFEPLRKITHPGEKIV